MSHLTDRIPLLPESAAAVQAVLNDPKVKKVLEQAVSQEIFTIEEQIEICEVPAPPMQEQKRAELIAQKIEATVLRRRLILLGMLSPVSKALSLTVRSAP